MTAAASRKPTPFKARDVGAGTTTFVHILPPEASCVFRYAGANAFLEDFNAAFASRFDLDARTARGLSVKDLMAAEAAAALIRAVRRCLNTHRTVRLTTPILRAGGGARVVGLTLKQIEPDCVIATVPETIVFGRRQSDKQMLETLGAVDGGTIFVLDMRDTSVVYVTEKVDQLIGYSREAIEGLITDPNAPDSDFFRGIFHPDDSVAVAAFFTDLRNARDDAVVTLVCRIRHASAGWRWIETRARILSRTRDGQVQRIVGVTVDVTEHRQLTADLRATSFALLRAEENERRRIAREIHDSTSQHLVALDLALKRLDNIPASDPAARRDLIEEMRGLTRTAQQELRVATFALHPPELERAGLADTLRELIRGFGRRTGLAADFRIEGDPRPVAAAVEHALLRVSQEALLNTHKHARARIARLRLTYGEDAVTVEIEDDGVGAESMQAGVGLQSMKARLAALGGVLSIVSSSGGFLVRASVRMDKHAR